MSKEFYNLKEGTQMYFDEIYKKIMESELYFDDLEFEDMQKKEDCINNLRDLIKKAIKKEIDDYPADMMYNINNYDEVFRVVDIWAITDIKNFDDIWRVYGGDLCESFSSSVDSFVKQYFTEEDKDEILGYWADKVYSLLDDINEELEYPDFHYIKVGYGMNGEEIVERLVDEKKVEEKMDWVFSCSFGGLTTNDFHYVYGYVYLNPDDGYLYNLFNAYEPIPGWDGSGRYWTLEKISDEEAKRIFKEYGDDYDEKLCKQLGIIEEDDEDDDEDDYEDEE